MSKEVKMGAIEIDFQKLSEEWTPQFESLAQAGHIYDPRNWEMLWPGTPARWVLKFLFIAAAASTDSTCLNRHTGAVLVGLEKRQGVIITPFALSACSNGSPIGVKPCTVLGYCGYKKIALEEFIKLHKLDPDLKELPTIELKEEFHKFKDRYLMYCQAVHAEENAIYFSRFCPLYKMIFTTTNPCPRCAKMLAQNGVAAVVYSTPYEIGSTRKHPRLARETELLFESTHISCVNIFLRREYLDWILPEIESAGEGIKDINDY